MSSRPRLRQRVSVSSRTYPVFFLSLFVNIYPCFWALVRLVTIASSNVNQSKPLSPLNPEDLEGKENIPLSDEESSDSSSTDESPPKSSLKTSSSAPAKKPPPQLSPSQQTKALSVVRKAISTKVDLGKAPKPYQGKNERSNKTSRSGVSTRNHKRRVAQAESLARTSAQALGERDGLVESLRDQVEELQSQLDNKPPDSVVINVEDSKIDFDRLFLQGFTVFYDDEKRTDLSHAKYRADFTPQTFSASHKQDYLKAHVDQYSKLEIGFSIKCFEIIHDYDEEGGIDYKYNLLNTSPFLISRQLWFNIAKAVGKQNEKDLTIINKILTTSLNGAQGYNLTGDRILLLAIASAITPGPSSQDYLETNPKFFFAIFWATLGWIFAVFCPFVYGLFKLTLALKFVQVLLMSVCTSCIYLFIWLEYYFQSTVLTGFFDTPFVSSWHSPNPSRKYRESSFLRQLYRFAGINRHAKSNVIYKKFKNEGKCKLHFKQFDFELHRRVSDVYTFGNIQFSDAEQYIPNNFNPELLINGFNKRFGATPPVKTQDAMRLMTEVVNDMLIPNLNMKVLADFYNTHSPADWVWAQHKKGKYNFSDAVRYEKVAMKVEQKIAEWRIHPEMMDYDLKESSHNEMNHLKIFEKAEQYLKLDTGIRFIVNECDFRKVLGGYLYWPIEKAIENSTWGKNHLVKGLSMSERVSKIRERFDGADYFIESDGSSFESSVDAWMLSEVEWKCYSHVLSEVFSQDVGMGNVIAKCFQMFQLVDHRFDNKKYYIDNVPPMRLSGSPNTSIGNALCNAVMCLAMFKKQGYVVMDYFVEGDDGIFAIRHAVSLHPLEGFGIRMSFDTATRWTDLSFCGFKYNEDGSLNKPIQQLKCKLMTYFNYNLLSMESQLKIWRAKLFSYHSMFGENLELWNDPDVQTMVEVCGFATQTEFVETNRRFGVGGWNLRVCEPDVENLSDFLIELAP